MADEGWKKNADPEAFWRLVALAREDMEAFRKALRELDRREVIRFAWMFEDAASRLWAERYRRHADPELSEDAYEDLADWVVGQGRDYYEGVLEKPATMPREAKRPDPALRMRYEAGTVFHERFGEEIPPVGHDD